MKKLTYSKSTIGIAALAILTTFTAKAQITINQNDLFQIGSSYILENDTIPTVTPGPAGASLAWNLGALKNGYVDTGFAVAPSSTPYSSNYPGANVAIRVNISGLGKSFEYFNSGADSLTVPGTVVPFGFTTAYVTNTPSEIALPFSAAYNTSWHGSYRNVTKYGIIPGDSVKGVILFKYTSTIDGWGTVTTPAGSYNSLRVNSIFTAVYDSVYQFAAGNWSFYSTLSPVPSQIYTWYAKGKGIAVATLNLDTAGKGVTSANYLLKSAAGINEITNNSSALVYPNPASSSLNIVVKATNQNGYIKTIDLTGREIESTPFNNGRAQLNTSGYVNGMYLYFITDITGNLIDKGKFTISH